MTDPAKIKIARDACTAALKKLMTSGKGAAGAEGNYAEAYRTLAKLDPTFTLPRKKYLHG